MSGPIPKSYLASILGISLSIFGCSSSDDGGGATVPTDAITITEANAKQIVADVIAGGAEILDAVDSASAIDVDQAPSAMSIIDRVMDKAKSIDSSSVLSTVSGVAFTISDDCADGGTYSADGDSTISGTNEIDSGTITFTNCTELGITLNGTLTFRFSQSLTSGAYSNALSGSISGSDGVETLTLSGLSLDENGNTDSGTYSINTYTFSADFTGGGGYLTELLAAITGNDADTCPTSGAVQVTGANSTQAKATINTDETVAIEFNDGSGTFTEVTGSPFPCTDFFI